MTMTHEQAVSTLASERYLLEEMSDAERSTFEEHYFSCEECADDVRAGGLMRDGARAGLMKSEPGRARMARGAIPRPAAGISPRRFRGRLPPRSPWWRATRRSSPRGPFSHPMALEPVTLRPASRGQEAAARVQPAAVVVFAVDVNSAVCGLDIPYTSARPRVSRHLGQVARPQPGSPLLMLVPSAVVGSAWALHPDDRRQRLPLRGCDTIAGCPPPEATL